MTEVRGFLSAILNHTAMWEAQRLQFLANDALKEAPDPDVTRELRRACGDVWVRVLRYLTPMIDHPPAGVSAVSVARDVETAAKNAEECDRGNETRASWETLDQWKVKQYTPVLEAAARRTTPARGREDSITVERALREMNDVLARGTLNGDQEALRALLARVPTPPKFRPDNAMNLRDVL